MTYQQIIKKVSQETNLPYRIVDKTYKAYWLFIKEQIRSLPLKQVSNEEEFSKLRTNFNIPSLGKLYVTWNSYLGCKERYKRLKNLNKNVKDKED